MFGGMGIEYSVGIDGIVAVDAVVLETIGCKVGNEFFQHFSKIH